MAADAVLRLVHNVLDGLVVNEAVIARAVADYLPFIATENLMMEAVKRGADRQQVHEIIRVASMAATAKVKAGEACDLVERLAAEPTFGLSAADIEAVLDPALYIGRCPEQVDRYLAEVAPRVEGVVPRKVDIDV